MKRSILKASATVAACALAAAVALTGCPQEITPDVGWTAAVENSAVVVRFNSSVRLEASNIVFASDAVEVLDVSGADRMWTVRVNSTATNNTVTMRINRGGISSRPQQVNLAGVGPFSYNVVRTGQVDGSATVSAFRIDFGGAVSGLQASNISVTNAAGGTVALVAGSLRQLDDSTWIINYTGTGTVRFSITGRPDVDLGNGDTSISI